MLVLSRRVGQEIQIKTPEGVVISLMVTEIRGGKQGKKVRLGFSAPRNYEILRDDAINREQPAGA